MAKPLIPNVRRNTLSGEGNMVVKRMRKLKRIKVFVDATREKRSLGSKILHNVTKRNKFNGVGIVFNKFSNG